MKRLSTRLSCAAVLALLLPVFRGLASEPNPEVAGRAYFREHCLLCHTAETNDGGGGQGPSLIRLLGRHAASDPAFGYSVALRAADLTWDPESIAKFLAAPTTVVPGTTMATAVADPTDRAHLVMYFFGALDDPGDSTQQPKKITTRHEVPDWKRDAPGRLHHVDPHALPAPFDTPSAHNFAKFVPRPAAARLRVPVGFHIDEYAVGLLGPRKMLVAPNGDVLVTEITAGRISVLHPAADGTRSARSEIYADGLKQPFGLAFYPDEREPRWLYVAENHRVIRFPWQPGSKPVGGDPEVVAALPSGGGHFTRDLAFSPNGRWLYVSVGSATNAAESMPKKTLAETGAWQSTHATGAAWAGELNRADVLVYDVRALGNPLAPAMPAVFATGLRNCVSLTVQPATGDLWCTTNERDRLGDDLVADYATRVREGGFYGWPWFYLGSNEDPHFMGDRPDLGARVQVPDVLFQAHSAALNLTFYAASAGKSAFPKQYVGDGFAAFHGSWNRSLRTGHKLVRVRMKDGVPTGSYEDFLTGFIVNEGDAWGRPVATTELADGSLLMSDDGGNLIYRISYRRP